MVDFSPKSREVCNEEMVWSTFELHNCYRCSIPVPSAFQGIPVNCIERLGIYLGWIGGLQLGLLLGLLLDRRRSSSLWLFLEYVFILICIACVAACNTS